MSVRGELSQQLDEHLALLGAASISWPLLDIDLAEDIHRRLVAVLERWDDLGEDQRTLVAATVEYVVTDDDEEHDLRSPIGLEDDAEHVAELERRLGLTPAG